ncbi:MAG: tRNA (adenosine(37)-N6)-threonylcarbamoyltransferase complex transferase subunit TsaD [Cytophagaceae bacterium]|nr:tRNA (adenosine(37)-N6)-threonylcarbamoyltransferase complex transferase subunit TsaD [Cytophagaceae bacterium]MDW8456832.1 tRNA (adenosine(37)-N6)-threonylcarbamoyltransferase complex transferase subunit TsaD [Cytophagaceae bacterium]
MTYILGIETSCDETAAAVMYNGHLLSNVIATQKVHEQYGGVVPELASRAHQQNIVPVVAQALSIANISKYQVNAVAFTQGPGLLGSLLVGSSFAKAFALAYNIPLIAVNHMEAHVHAHFIEEPKPEFPFICLTVSGGHTEILLMKDYFDKELLGTTLDDAVGEAFDKAAKILGLPYPGGPMIDKLSKTGNPLKYKFPVSQVDGLNFSFSGIKTSILYFVRDNLKTYANFIQDNIADLCASIQHTLVKMLTDKLLVAVNKTGVNRVAIAGGVSANTYLRDTLQQMSKIHGWEIFIPKFEYCTDNAAMIAMSGYLKYRTGQFSSQEVVAQPSI